MSHATVLVAPTLEKIAELGDVEKAVAWEMEPFDENEECFRDGSRWDWYQIGGRYEGRLGGKDIVQVKQIDPKKYYEDRVRGFTETYEEAMEKENAEMRHFIWGVEPGETLEQFLARTCKPEAPLAAYAFLSNRHWHEAERMGWFGSSTYTECERKDMEAAKGDPEKWFGKCLHKDEATGARIVCWNEPEEVWQDNFYRRFVATLAPERTVVMVDYHV